MEQTLYQACSSNIYCGFWALKGMLCVQTNSKIVIIIGLVVLTIGLAFFPPPIPQDLCYHNFVDKRTLFGIANFWNVVSNLPYIVLGIMGLRVHPNSQESWFWWVFFCGVLLVGIGSGYYHLDPTNATLVWDRLPMTIAFMAFFSFVIYTRINHKTGLVLLPILLILGIGSIWYWAYTESLGAGDLRPYALVQFGPILWIPIIFWLFPVRFPGTKYFVQVLLWYGLAKLFEHFDAAVYILNISGHTLKHLASAVAVYMIMCYLKAREI